MIFYDTTSHLMACFWACFLRRYTYDPDIGASSCNISCGLYLSLYIYIYVYMLWTYDLSQAWPVEGLLSMGHVCF